MRGKPNKASSGVAVAAVFAALMPALTWVGPATAGEEAIWSPPPLSGEPGDLPEGRDVVRRAIEFMKSHDRMGFEAVATYEVVQENGQKLQFDMLQRVALEQPRRLHWVTLNDDATTEFTNSWYDWIPVRVHYEAEAPPPPPPPEPEWVGPMPWDRDSDGIPNSRDNCPDHPNPGQKDLDGDMIGNACDDDIDGDGVKNDLDAFPYNPAKS